MLGVYFLPDLSPLVETLVLGYHVILLLVCQEMEVVDY